MIEIAIAMERTFVVKIGDLSIPTTDRADADSLARAIAEAINTHSMSPAKVVQRPPLDLLKETVE